MGSVDCSPTDGYIDVAVRLDKAIALWVQTFRIWGRDMLLLWSRAARYYLYAIIGEDNTVH
jgi:hypothetical protein